MEEGRRGKKGREGKEEIAIFAKEKSTEMAKEFNTAVTCDPRRHYMVDTTEKMKVFERLINGGKYFTISYARQFGKSTSLNWILRNMSDRYLVIPASFEITSPKEWSNEDTFCRYFCTKIVSACENVEDKDVVKFWEGAKQTEKLDFDILASKITEFCRKAGKKVVLTIDEVDKSLDNQLFLGFLSMLRSMYLDREKFGDEKYTFWSVVLAGVYDVKSMKVRIRPDEEHRFNSPWNVAAEYDLEMEFNPREIGTMLEEYEEEHHIGFDIKEIAEEIYKYTSGYPVLVSRICKEIDENLERSWTKEGVLKAVKRIIGTKTNLSESMTSNLELNPKLKAFIRALLMENFSVLYDANNPTMDFARMFSIIKKDNEGRVEIHNLIFQQILINYFISENELETLTPGVGLKTFIDKNGDLNMPMIINRFKDLVSKKHNKEAEFLEREGRFMFICFLKPIINGTGFYYSEPENDDSTRMDLVINYNRKEYVVELKIWHGTEYEISGREQIAEYLTTRNLEEGYLVTFSFLKNKVVQERPEWIEHSWKRIYEAVI